MGSASVVGVTEDSVTGVSDVVVDGSSLVLGSSPDVDVSGVIGVEDELEREKKARTYFQSGGLQYCRSSRGGGAAALGFKN